MLGGCDWDCTFGNPPVAVAGRRRAGEGQQRKMGALGTRSGSLAEQGGSYPNEYGDSYGPGPASHARRASRG